jgi:hypothetical protein
MNGSAIQPVKVSKPEVSAEDTVSAPYFNSRPSPAAPRQAAMASWSWGALVLAGLGSWCLLVVVGYGLYKLLVR